VNANQGEHRPKPGHEQAAAQMQRGDLTKGPILRTLIVFSVPTLFANVLQTLGQTINTIWVGQLLGQEAVAATVNANMVVFLAFAAVYGFGMATTVKVGQHFGARHLDHARLSFGSGVGFCTALALVGTVVGLVFGDPLLRLLATPEAVHAQALAYLQVMFVSMPFSTASMMISMGLRGSGDPKSPLHAMIVTTVLTILLNPVLILGLGPVPEMGIAGSALANALAAFGGMLFMVVAGYVRDLPLRLKGHELAYLVPRREELAFILSKGLPMGAQMLITTAASLFMIRFINDEGMVTAAAYGAVMQVWNYIQMPAFAISTAVSAMVAQSVGAALHDRVARINTVGVVMNTIVTTALTVVLLLFDRPLLALFLGDAAGTIELASEIQLIATWSWVLTGAMMVISGTLRSYGVVMVPLIIMIISQYVVRIGFYYAFYGTLGADAIWWSYVFSAAVALLLTWLAYRYGGWRRKEIPSEGARPAPAG
jgi:putative MATE family efflux protein